MVSSVGAVYDIMGGDGWVMPQHGSQLEIKDLNAVLGSHVFISPRPG